MPKIINSGLVLLAQAQAAEESINIDTFIYANIPGLDPTQEVSSTEVMPATGNIVYQGTVNRRQYLSDHAVLYSNQIGAAVGDFEFNWIGLYDSTAEVLVAVAYLPLQEKYKNSLVRIGNILVKNFVLKFSNIATLSGIDINLDPQSNPDFYLVNMANALIADQISYHEQKINPHPVYMTELETDVKILEHEEKVNPHPQYMTEDETDGKIDEHKNEENPHPVYMTETEVSIAIYDHCPAGIIIDYPANNVPAGYASCNGASYPKTGIYAGLFAAIGYIYGGSGENFNVPDRRD